MDVPFLIVVGFYIIYQHKIGTIQFVWLNVNRLSLHVSKTNYTIFHPYNKPLKKHITIKINKKAIIEKYHIKYLGVIIDSPS